MEPMMTPPRARGGVPATCMAAAAASCSSPRTRGCSPRAWWGIEDLAAPPRARGGVPSVTHAANWAAASSPRTRGCSRAAPAPSARVELLPAHAGVFPSPHDRGRGDAPPPRARGGVPLDKVAVLGGRASSPRTRGCSLARRPPIRPPDLLPAHAGVFPFGAVWAVLSVAPPRARGGVPSAPPGPRSPPPSSPRTRGCSQRSGAGVGQLSLLPAHAGVFPEAAPAPSSSGPPPRARGGVPGRRGRRPRRAASSPRTRGCSQCGGRGEFFGTLLPAHAGVFPAHAGRGRPRPPPPRARGGVPNDSRAATTCPVSSPRTRGCSRGPPRRSGWRRLLPAHAGVFPG